ncbi:MAG: Hsp20/alpha crystallin family protein [Bradymonadaceae bacterium]|nr:Hsp20/alpha crystallin family protein [Lujinxingiaceae bacterium]
MAKKSSSETRDLQVRDKEELQAGEGTREGLYFKPDVDIYETSRVLMVVTDVPGTSAKNFEIDLRDNLLTITGYTRPVEDRWQPLYTEFRTGHFSRQFRLGQQIDQSKISAELTDGVLRLNLPKAESTQPRKIEVKAR